MDRKCKKRGSSMTCTKMEVHLPSPVCLKLSCVWSHKCMQHSGHVEAFTPDLLYDQYRSIVLGFKLLPCCKCMDTVNPPLNQHTVPPDSILLRPCSLHPTPPNTLSPFGLFRYKTPILSLIIANSLTCVFSKTQEYVYEDIKLSPSLLLLLNLPHLISKFKKKSRWVL